MAKKVKLTPTTEQILKAKSNWNQVKHDIYDMEPRTADKIQFAFNLKQWDKVYKLCAEIGQDEISIALSGNKIL